MYKLTEAFKGKEGNSVMSLENLRAVGFYLGDDCEKALMSKVLPSLVADLEVHVEGVTVNGIHINVRLFVGGDLKVPVAMLGLASCSSFCCRPFCLVTQPQLALAEKELHATWVMERTIQHVQMCAHIPHPPMSLVQGPAKADGTPPAMPPRPEVLGPVTAPDTPPASSYPMALAVQGPATADGMPPAPLPLLLVSTCTVCGEVSMAKTKTKPTRHGPKYCGEMFTTAIAAEPRKDVARMTWQQQHYGGVDRKGALVTFISISVIMVDILHVCLRPVVPSMFRATISARCTSEKALDVSTWALHSLDIVVSKDIAVHTAKRKKQPSAQKADGQVLHVGGR
eukprot:jgi/Tetstr1/457008/TSEL_043672.t1